MNSPIHIAEQFSSLQGEGVNQGAPAIFLRVAGCDLQCGVTGDMELGDVDTDTKPGEGASWICDSIPVWRKASWSPTVDELLEDWLERGWIDKLKYTTHLILTGGEPTMESHQKSLSNLLSSFRYRFGKPHFVEVETNGTNVPAAWFDAYIDQYNCSVKLSNSGMAREKRLVEEALWFHAKNPSSYFKFVVSNEEDVGEVHSILDDWSIHDERVLLMPAGASRGELDETRELVAGLCKENGWRYSARLHINLWNLKTGV